LAGEKEGLKQGICPKTIGTTGFRLGEMSRRRKWGFVSSPCQRSFNCFRPLYA